MGEEALDSVITWDTFGVDFGALLRHPGHFRHRDDSLTHHPWDSRGTEDRVDLGRVCYTELDIDGFPCEDTAVGDTESDADVAGFTLDELKAGGWLGDGQWRGCWLGGNGNDGRKCQKRERWKVQNSHLKSWSRQLCA